jgi:hypothetical protein
MNRVPTAPVAPRTPGKCESMSHPCFAPRPEDQWNGLHTASLFRGRGIVSGRHCCVSGLCSVFNIESELLRCGGELCLCLWFLEL